MIGGKLIDFPGHCARLRRSLAELGLPSPATDDEILAIHRELVSRNGLELGHVYLMVTRGEADRDFVFPKADTPASFVLFTQRRDAIETREAEHGLKVASVPDLRWGRRDIKTVQLLYPSMAKMEAKRKGKDDAWFVENGTVTEGTSNNAYIVTHDGAIRTRALGHDILHGITRAALLKVGRRTRASCRGAALHDRGGAGRARGLRHLGRRLRDAGRRDRRRRGRRRAGRARSRAACAPPISTWRSHRPFEPSGSTAAVPLRKSLPHRFGVPIERENRMSTRDIVFIALFAALMAVLGTLSGASGAADQRSDHGAVDGRDAGGRHPRRPPRDLAILLFIVIVLAGPAAPVGRSRGPCGAGRADGRILPRLAAGGLRHRRADRTLHAEAELRHRLPRGRGRRHRSSLRLRHSRHLAGHRHAPLLTAAKGSLAFIPGDLVKAGLAAAIIVTVSKAYPLIETRTARRAG